MSDREPRLVWHGPVAWHGRYNGDTRPEAEGQGWYPADQTDLEDDDE